MQIYMYIYMQYKLIVVLPAVAANAPYAVATYLILFAVTT